MTNTTTHTTPPAPEPTGSAAAPADAAALSPEDLRADPLRFGVGARITVAVMTDDYVRVITDALGALDASVASDLVVDTGDVSTYLGGDEATLLRAVTDLAEAIAASGHHATIALHLSRGCPGEAVCAVPGGAGARAVSVPEPRETGRFASAEWALYPLADQPVADGVEPDHMRDILAAIERARDNGTFRGSEHFVTRLEGDLGAVLGTVFAGWTMVGRTVQHVTCHATLSLNSPSHAGAGR
ncbi:MAG: YkoF family thiamine/hydroxymethylpyrimidine-binding protein [Pseudoclavibacter sp.]